MRKIQENLLEAICSKENLILAWRRVENSYQHGDVWFDELEISAFKFNLVQNIERLSKQMKKGEYKMKPIKPAPYPKRMKVKKDEGGQETKELRVRQSFCINVEDQVVWMAVYGILGPYFEEEMPAWSYGNRLFLNSWKDEKGHWINGVYRTTSRNFYRKWTQGWPLYRHMLEACIDRMAFPGKKDEERGDDVKLTIEDNNAQVNEAFKLPYLEKEYFVKDGIYHTKLYYVSIDLEKFYPSVKMDNIRKKILSSFPINNDSFTSLINAITTFEVIKDGCVFSEQELNEMGLNADVDFEGLPTGLLVAGALANLYLLDLDKKVINRLKTEKKHCILHFRYVDDHLFLSYDQNELVKWKVWYLKELESIELRVNQEKTDEKPIELDSRYPTPLITQTLHKISDIAKMPLDLLNTNEFNMVFRDLQMLLVTEFPEEEIKKGTRTSFACTMLSRLTSDINVDYAEIHKRRKEWLSYVDNQPIDKDVKKRLKSLVFTVGDEYLESLDKDLKDIVKEGYKYYDAIIAAIGNSREEISKIEERIFHLLIYSLQEVPDKPKMWLRILNFCICHIPENVQELYDILGWMNKNRQIHDLGYEYIVSVMNIHLAMQVMRCIARLSANQYNNPRKKDIDKRLLAIYVLVDDKFSLPHHYLYEDANFIVNRTKMWLSYFNGEANGSEFLNGCQYHHLNLDSSFWLLWGIEKFNRKKPTPKLMMPDFLKENLGKANTDSDYFLQLLFSCINQVSLDSFGKIDFKKLKLSNLQKENLLLSVWGRNGAKQVIKVFGLDDKKMASPNKISLIQWIHEVHQIELSDNDILGNALCSEYAATLIMKNVVDHYCNDIEHIDSFCIHPAAILVKREDCLKEKDWDNWLSPNKEIEIKVKDSFIDEMYRYPSFVSEEYSPMVGTIYGLGIIFLQLLTKEFSLPWVLNRPEYGYEWQSVLYRLLARGKVSSTNYEIIDSCLSLENRETIKLKSILNNAVCAKQRVNDVKIETIEDLRSALVESLKELKENQISVANHETRQLIKIKL